jgi:hypothetical protein
VSRTSLGVGKIARAQSFLRDARESFKDGDEYSAKTFIELAESEIRSLLGWQEDHTRKPKVSVDSVAKL